MRNTNMTSSSLPYWRLSSFYFFYFAVVGALTPYWGVYLKSLGYSSQDIGIISAIIMATRIVAPNFWGWLADKTQQRLSIIRKGSALACVCFAGVLINQQYAWLVFVIAAYTFFWHAVLPQFEVITLNHLGKEFHRYSQIRLWGSIGFMIAVVGLGFLFDYVSIRFLPISILVLLILIWLSSLSISDIPVKQNKKIQSTFFAVVRQPVVMCFLCASFFLQLSYGAYYTFYSLYLQDHYHYSSTVTGLLWALGVLAEIAVFMVMSHIMHRFSVRFLLLASFLITAIRWFIIGYGADWFWLLIFAQLLHAVSFGVAHAASIEVVRRQFKGENQGQGQALYNSLSYGLGGMVGALACGFLWDYSASFTFALSGVMASLAFVIGYFGLHFTHSHTSQD